MAKEEASNGMDIDDLLGPGRPSLPTARMGRFQPNFGKFKSKPKPEPKTEPDSTPIILKKQDDSLYPESTLEPSRLNAAISEEVEVKSNVGEEIDFHSNLEAKDADAEEDCVVREIDVFLNPRPVGNAKLYLMQYPLRPYWRPYELNERCLEVKIRPDESKLEIDLEKNEGNQNYDDAIASKLGFEKQILSSSKVPCVTSYAVGYFSGNKLHLNPLHAIVQFRPSLEYLDAGQKNGNANGGEDIGNSMPWISLEYQGLDSPSSVGYRKSMSVVEGSPIQFTMKSLDYVNSLCPGASSLDNEAKGPSKSSEESAERDLNVAHHVATPRTTSMPSETRDALSKALPELFHNHKVCSLQLICQVLRDMAVSKSAMPKADARARAARAAAHGVDFLPELQVIINQIAISIHGVYVLKSLRNPKIDPLRSVVINLFRGREPNAKLKKADIIEAAKIKLGREVSNSEYIQVVNELCISNKGGAWMLKSGDGKP